MKKNFRTFTEIGIALILCMVFCSVLLIYTRPMEDISLDLSLIVQDAHVAQVSDDEKGWTVYTRSGEDVKELEPTGSGSYLGIGLGETFYYSRVMTEELNSPTLQIGTSERMFSVWLDDTLIYTDCPELDNRIGYVTLPMNTAYRQEPITLTLPMNYAGKTLTIAQSTPTWAETPTIKAIPASVKLYCGYAYESGIVSESFSAAIAATAVFVLALSLLLAFVRTHDIGMLCIALSAFLWMCVILRDVSFFTKYFSTEFIAVNRYAQVISAAALSVFLTLKAGRHKSVMRVIAGLQGATVLVSLFLSSRFEHTINRIAIFFMFSLMEWAALAGFLAVLVLGIGFWRKETPFYRIFAPTALGITVVHWIALLSHSAEARTTIRTALVSGQVTLLYTQTFTIMMLTALACAVCEAIRQELVRRTEKRLLEERREMMLGSYENMRRQNEEVMKLRHDTLSHYEMLRGIVRDEKAAAYLEDLIGQNKKIRSVVQTGNEMLDIILNNKLGEAQDAGIAVEIVKSEAPEKLPLTDTDLCSLVMNIMSNAVKAAAVSGAVSPYIRLNMHIKNNYFSFACENSAAITPTAFKSPDLTDKTETVHEHGLGLKIIHEIAEKYDGILKKVTNDDTFEVRIAIPLSTPQGNRRTDF